MELAKVVLVSGRKCLMNSEVENLNLNNKIQLENQYRLQWEKAQDCFVLLYPEGMVKLPGSSGEIMQLVNGKYSAEEIVAELERKFPDTNLRDDVIVFLKKVFSNGWIREE